MLRHWIELLFIGLFHADEQRLKTLGLHRSRNQQRQGGKAKNACSSQALQLDAAHHSFDAVGGTFQLHVRSDFQGLIAHHHTA